MTRKQRRRAWGSITEVKRGKKCILRWQENTPCGRKRPTKTVYGTYREACTELDRIHVERTEDNPVPTIAQVYGTWLELTFGSCRSGEPLGICTDEVLPFAAESTTLATVDLVRQMEQAGIEPTADGVLKTRKSMRTVVVLPDAAGRLLEIAGERRAAGSEWLADRGDGLPMNRGMCNHRWKKWCAAEGVEHIPWSNLRNSWRTICEMELHMPWDLMEMLMGHSLPGVSGRHYIRPSREQVARSVCDALGINWDISQQISRYNGRG